MLRYVIRRVALLIPTLFFVALIVFTLAHLAPGSPFERNETRPLPASAIERLNRIYGIDQPIPVQFALYMNDLIHLDLGSSLRSDRAVSDIIGHEFPVTAQLGVQALILALIVALPLGIVSALRQNTATDHATMVFATIGTTIPSFVVAIFAIYIFGVYLRLVPFIGWGTPKHMILPTIILALGPTAFLTRMTRVSMLEAIHQDHIRTARGKGLSERFVVVGHALKNALIPVATVVGPTTAGLITGSFIVETLFNVPGIGREFVLSVQARDYPLIMGVYLLYAVVIMVANLTVDLVYGLIDPRIKFAA